MAAVPRKPPRMSTSTERISHTGDSAAGPFPYPFDRLEPRYIVTVLQRAGLHEVLGQASDEEWIVRALNDPALPLVYVTPEAMRGFDLPIFQCYASRDRSVISILVNGDDYDVTREDVPEVEEPLFQEVHPAGLMAFAELAVSAGFSLIELSNGYQAWQGRLDELIDRCRHYSPA